MADGTQNDPYVVTTWDELVEKAAVSGVYVKLGNNIDLNDEYPEGITSRLTLNCTEIDGDNYAIRNLANKNSDVLYPAYGVNATIKNTKFSNFYIRGSSFVLNSNDGSLTFDLCEFSGSLNEGATFATQTATLRRCSMNIDLHGCATSPSTYSGQQTNYYYCNIKVKNGVFRMIGENNYITGENIDVYSGLGKYNVIDALVPTGKGITLSDDHWRGYYNTNTLINNDKVTGSMSFNASDGNYALTESLLTNAEYLSSIGFPIQT